MAVDIGVTLFVELLGMTQYPGSPFTGNIYRDLIMFLIVPTVFIIMVIYTMTGRLIADSRFRIMIGVTAYLFIIASGYYPAFALLAGPYFVFLIFILGLLYFIGGHFRSARGGGGGGPFSHHNDSHDSGGGGMSRKGSLLRTGTINPIRKRDLEDDFVSVLESIAAADGAKEPRQFAELVREKNHLSVELYGHRLTRDEIKKKFGIELPKNADR